MEDGDMCEGVAAYEGSVSRLNCEVCGEVFEEDGDVHAGQEVECSECGAHLEVSGR